VSSCMPPVVVSDEEESQVVVAWRLRLLAELTTTCDKRMKTSAYTKA